MACWLLQPWFVRKYEGLKLLLKLAMLLTPVAEIFYFSQWNHNEHLDMGNCFCCDVCEETCKCDECSAKNSSFVSLQSISKN